MNGLTKKEEHCRDYYHSGVRWRPGVGGWPIQNTTEWAAAAAPKTVAKAITNNYKSPTDWILFEIKVAPTEYYLLTWSAGCWASGGPPACCPPPSPRRGSSHITTSHCKGKRCQLKLAEIVHNISPLPFKVGTSVKALLYYAKFRWYLSVTVVSMWWWSLCPLFTDASCFTLHCPPPSVPRPVPRTVSALGFPTQKQSVPDPATQTCSKISNAVIRTCSYWSHKSLTHGVPKPQSECPQGRDCNSNRPPFSVLSPRLRIGDVRSRPAETRARPRVESRGGAW